MQLVGCLLLLVFILIFVVIAFFGSILVWLRSLFGFTPREKNHQQQNSQDTDTSRRPHTTKKVIDEDEGEYVSFEEIKNDDNHSTP